MRTTSVRLQPMRIKESDTLKISAYRNSKYLGSITDSYFRSMRDCYNSFKHRKTNGQAFDELEITKLDTGVKAMYWVTETVIDVRFKRLY